MNRIVPLLVAAAFLGACGTTAAAEPRPTLAVEEGTDQPAASTAAPAPVASAPAGAEPLVMPDLTGRSLLHANDELVAAGMTVGREDVSGLGRTFVNDSIWIVCAQVPEPAAKVAPTEMVTLYAVKVGEVCPGA